MKVVAERSRSWSLGGPNWKNCPNEMSEFSIEKCVTPAASEAPCDPGIGRAPDRTAGNGSGHGGRRVTENRHTREKGARELGSDARETAESDGRAEFQYRVGGDAR